MPKNGIVFAESPIFILSAEGGKFTQNTVIKAIKWLSLRELDALSGLSWNSNKFKIDNALSKFMSNAFNLPGKPGQDSKGLFLVVARINHSHAPNMSFVWSAKNQQLVFIALRDIAKGEELTIAYCCLFSGSTETMKNGLTFSCRCGPCSVTSNTKGSFKDSDKPAVEKTCVCSFCQPGPPTDLKNAVREPVIFDNHGYREEAFEGYEGYDADDSEDEELMHLDVRLARYSRMDGLN
jgi:hypothetical protein